MNYGGNMPDWHQYNSLQGARTSSVGQQNGTGQHIFIPGISPPSIDGINLGGASERHRGGGSKNDYVGGGRNYGPGVSGGHVGGGPLGVGYGGGGRNPMIDGDPRMGGISEEHRNGGQMAFVAPPVANSGGVVVGGSSQNSPIGSMSPGRGQSYPVCKAPCCNPEPPNYQHWEKYYHNHGSYRENIRATYPPAAAASGPMDSRRFMPEMRKDCMDGKELGESGYPSVDHRGRNYGDYGKYTREKSVIGRNYVNSTSGNSLVHQNYPMQSYNFPTSADYQKCPYTGKEYVRRGANGVAMGKNPAMMKYQQEQASVIAQQKYNQHSKQITQNQYQNGTSSLPAVLPPGNANPGSNGSQNSYFNPPPPPHPRDYNRDYQGQDAAQVTSNRMAQAATSSHVHGSFQKYHVYHQKIAMQRFSVENHLRAFSRIPGYQNHPKYQECVMRYRELLRLQQNVDYQNIIQESPKIPSPVATSSSGNVPAPINLQFDQNGVLVNSSYIPYPPGIPSTSSSDISNIDRNGENFDNPQNFGEHGEQRQVARDPIQEAERYEEEAARGVDDPTRIDSVIDMTKSNDSEYKNSKDFADKPELDVRQFLANWDESEDEETANATATSTEIIDEFPAVDGSIDRDKSADEGEARAEESSIREAETIKIVADSDQSNIAMGKSIDCVVAEAEIDDIPTIHIVENLDEGGTEMEKIHKVFGSLTSAVLSPIDEAIDGNGSNRTIVLFEQDGISSKSLEFDLRTEENVQPVDGVIASIIESSDGIIESSDGIDDGKNDRETTTRREDAVNATEEKSACGATTKTTVTTTSVVSTSAGKIDRKNLRKQSSFTSDESHNPDDISLPDLQTSECTPISTTLNTPIHSDSEESIEQQDLTISTNPIEIIQNSPIISFTHSPLKIEPYEQLRESRIMAGNSNSTNETVRDSLDFDFDEEVASNENRKYNENCDSSPSSEVEELENQANLYERRISRENEKNEAENFYRADPLVGMTTTSPGSKEIAKSSEEKNSQVEDRADSGENRRDDDFDRSTDDLEKLCDMSLDASCMIPLIPSTDECDEPRMPVSPMEGNCLTKILNDTMPITDLDMLGSSDEKNHQEDDLWGQEVRNIEATSYEAEFTECTKDKVEEDATREKDPEVDENPVIEETEENFCEKISSPRATNDEVETTETRKPEVETRKPEVEPTKPEMEPTKPEMEPRQPEMETGKPEMAAKVVEECPLVAIPVVATEESPEPRKPETITRRFSREEISRDDEKVVENKRPETNLEIQVANFNVKIHENETSANDGSINQESIVEGVDAIEIKINLSRGDISRRVSKCLNEKFLDEDETRRRKKRKSGKIHRRRRRSMHDVSDDFDTKRMRKNDDDSKDIFVPKKIHKSRGTSGGNSHGKIRKSMDDELLRRDNESPIRETIFSKEIAKNVQRTRGEVNEEFDENEDNENGDKRKFKEKENYRQPSPSYNLENSSTLDFDNFDVASNHDSDTEKSTRFESNRDHDSIDRSINRSIDSVDRSINRNIDCIDRSINRNIECIDRSINRNIDGIDRSINRERHKNSSNLFDDRTDIDEFEMNLNTVPIYTTKDGRINYSPNRNYTYRALIIEAKKREKRFSNNRKFDYGKKSSRQTCNNSETRKSHKRHSGEKKNRDRTLTKSKRSSTRNRLELSEKIVSSRAKKMENRQSVEMTSELDDYRKEEAISGNSMMKNYPEMTNEIVDRLDSPRNQIFNISPLSSDEKSEIASKGVKNFSDNREMEISLSSKLFPQEVEIDARKVEKSSLDVVESEKSRFFQDSLKSTTMASPMTCIVEKRSTIWDTDCQTVLSDSGLESSTTYVEASKESRKLQKWKNSFVDRVERSSIYSTSRKKREENSTNEISSERNFTITKMRKIEETRKSFEETRKIANIFPRENKEMSEFVKSLDLAITNEKASKEKSKNFEIVKGDSVEFRLSREIVDDRDDKYFQIPELPEKSLKTRDEENVETEILENREDATFKDYLIDTCTSFSNCVRVPDAISELPTESETSRLEEDSTRFAPESMDFKENYENSMNYEFSNNQDRSIVVSMIVNEDTENAMNATSEEFSGKSSDSRRSGESQKAPILTFSGQIRNDSPIDSPSKSPPDLTVESYVPRIVENPETPENFVETSRFDAHPKIPKMIIRNFRSRPGTPTTQQQDDPEKSSIDKREEKKLDAESKIPKMKIKLEELTTRIVDNSEDSGKNVPRMRIKKMRKSSRSPTTTTEKLPLVGKLSRQSSESEDFRDDSYKFTILARSKSRGDRSASREENSEEVKIPKLTIKKPIEKSSSQSSGTKKRTSSSPHDSRKHRRGTSTKSSSSSRREEPRSRNFIEDSNNDSHQSVSGEKVPKVIIKRASPSAEFKCELSKDDRDAIIKDSKWQPEVKLRRFWVLDCMAKEPGNGQVALQVLESTLVDSPAESIFDTANRKRGSSDSRSRKNDVKTRRKSDCDYPERSNENVEKNRRRSLDNIDCIDKIDCIDSIDNIDRSKSDIFQFPSRRRDEKSREMKSANETENSMKKSIEIFNETQNSLIKLDSSDESQTTIELLPASLDDSQNGLDGGNEYFSSETNGNLGKLYSEDAIPTQFELELEIVDNSNIDTIEVPIPPIDHESCHEDDARVVKNVDDRENFDRKKIREKSNSKNTCCSDSLVKEVLAAKETLKRCLSSRSKNIAKIDKSKPRPKTAAEKKQGTGYDYPMKNSKSETRVSRENENFSEKSKDVPEGEKKMKESGERSKTEKSHKPGDKKSSDKRQGGSSREESTSRSSKSSSSRKIEEKSRKIGENSRSSLKIDIGGKSNEGNSKIVEKSILDTKSYKIPKISRPREKSENVVVEEKRKSPSPGIMPILEPQIDLNFELSRNSDRDTSRSPPVITKQEEIERHAPKKIEDNVNSDKIDSIDKQRDNEAVTFADIVSKLAYHEKATIRHRRYCTLCERWFPTAARHRRHLTGYQHRHTELTQRRTVHALFMLFTGKPCPRLLPASIVRTDCLPGEPTPLQIAVQDVAINLEDGAREKPSKNPSEEKE